MSEQKPVTGTMTRGRSEAETCTLNGWTVGTHVRGHEQWGDGSGVWTTWRITAIGEDVVLARTVRSDYDADRVPDARPSAEHTVTFELRDWFEVTSEEAAVAPEADMRHCATRTSPTTDAPHALTTKVRADG